MTWQTCNEYAQPIGPALPAWTARPAPPRAAMHGRWCRVEPLAVEHAASLHAAYAEAPDARDWTYLSVGPFADTGAYASYVARVAAQDDPLHYAVVDRASGRALGTAALMRIDRSNGVIEVGSIAYSRRLQRTPAATEAMYLFLQCVFDQLGYRRFEWKCDHLNAPSRAAALRYGFTYEGIFRNAVIYKGRSRDTAWYSMIPAEWERVRDAYRRWLASENFTADGRQVARLADLRPAQGVP